MKILKIFLISLLLVFALETTVIAQGTTSNEAIQAVNLDENVTAADLGVREPTILPDSPLYFLKNWAWGIRMFFTLNPEKKAQLRLKLANKKLIEAEKMAQLKKNPKLVEKTLDSFQKEMDEIGKTKPDVLKKFSDKLIRQQLLHQKILEKLEKQVPPEAFKKIKEAREKHLERFAKVMEKTDKNFPEKLVNILEKEKGSKFKQFKELERLTEIENKLPNTAKKKISERKEIILGKLQKKLETLPAEKQEEFKKYVENIKGDKITHLKVLDEIMSGEISDNLREKLKETEEKKIENIEKTAKTPKEARAQIEKAENEILKAEEAVKTIDSEVYRGKAALKLLELSKEHLEKAKKAFNEGKYGRAFGLATASYHESLNCERVVKLIKEIQSSPEKKKEKFEELYPGILLPKKITKCKLIAPPRCPEGRISVRKDENGCPIFKCIPLPKPKKPEIPSKELPEEPRISPQKIVCPALWDPVCGTDGKIYSNECFAKVSGVKVVYKGVCKGESNSSRLQK